MNKRQQLNGSRSSDTKIPAASRVHEFPNEYLEARSGNCLIPRETTCSCIYLSRIYLAVARKGKICEACEIAYSKKVKDLTDGDLEKIRDQIALFTSSIYISHIW